MFSSRDGIQESTGAVTLLDNANADSVGATDLNDAGEVVGSLTLHSNPVNGIAFRRSPAGIFTRVPAPPGTISSISFAVNANGAITGGYEDSTGANHAFVFSVAP